MLNNTEKVAASLIILVFLIRVFPHPWNFTPALSVALFSGATFINPIFAIIIAIFGLALSNIILGFGFGSIVTIVLVATITCFGPLLRNKYSRKNCILYSAGSASIFFIISNFIVWMKSGMYPHSFSGLIDCYVKAIPFYGNNLLATIIFSLVLFEGHRFIKEKLITNN